MVQYREPNATGISSYGDDTTITGNTISNAAGAGVRVGTSKYIGEGYYGTNNKVGFIRSTAYSRHADSR